MEYQKITNLINDASNQLSKSRTKCWVQINDESRGTYSANSNIKIKTLMLKPSLFDYSDAYILVTGTITVNCTSEINNKQVDHAKDTDIIISINRI